MSDADQSNSSDVPEEIKPLALGKGLGFATKMITEEGAPVALMFREEPEDEEDSGWRFLSGFETQEYLADPECGGFYDVNDIANCDEEIVPFLDAPIGATFARNEDTNLFEEVDVEEIEEDQE